MTEGSTPRACRAASAVPSELCSAETGFRPGRARPKPVDEGDSSTANENQVVAEQIPPQLHSETKPPVTPFAQVGDYVMSTAWSGNAMGQVYEIGQVVKITPTKKVKIAFLPSEQVNRKRDDFFVQSWEKIITSHIPLSNKTLLVSPDGSYGTGTKYLQFEVIPESRLDEPFKEIYDGYN